MSYFVHNRRQFLRSSSGFVLAMPFLSSLMPSRAQAAGIPARFISVRTIYGQIPQHFYPGRPGQKISENVYYQSIAPGTEISQIIGSQFKSISHKLSIIRGLDHFRAGHNKTTMLCPCDQKLDTPTWSNSFDEVLARSSVIYPQTPAYRSLRLEPSLSVKYSPHHNYSFWNKQELPYERDMSALFAKMFKGAGQDNAPATKNRKAKAIDLAKDAYDRLKNSRKISSVDKNRLTQYADMLSDLETKVQTIQPLTCSIPSSINARGSSDIVYDAGVDMAMLALACGMTQVISFSAPWFTSRTNENGSDFHGKSHWTYDENNTFPDLGYGAERKMNFNLASESEYLRIYRWSANKVAALMTKMDSLRESNGKTLLDNSLVYWGNEFAGANHSNYSQPVVVAGTLGDKVKTGYWDYTRRPFIYHAGDRADIHGPAGTVPYTNFLTTLAKLYNIPSSSYEKPGVGGFGDFSISGFNYDFSGKIKAKDVYSAYVNSNADRRKSIPDWVKS